jgi:hypothetical protein
MKEETGYFVIKGKTTYADVLMTHGLFALQDLGGKEDVIMFRVIAS